jgi:hypothetical protein
MHSTSKVPGLGADWNAMRVRVSGGYMLQGVQWPWQSLAVVPLGISGPVAWIGCYDKGFMCLGATCCRECSGLGSHWLLFP